MGYHFYDKPFREMDEREQKEVCRDVQARVASGNLWDDEMKYIFRSRVFLANALRQLSILNLTEEEISSMVIQEEYIPGKAWKGWKNERKGKFDVYAIIRGGKRRIDLEIQRIVEKHEVMRAIFYFAKMIADRKKGTTVNEERSNISTWLFKSDISKMIPELKDMEPCPFYCFSFCTMKWENANILSPANGVPISPDNVIIFINGGFDWNALRQKRPLTEDEKNMESFILDMFESDTENIRNKVTRSVMEEYKREELDSDIVMTICENLTEDARELLRQKEIAARAEGVTEGIEKGAAKKSREIALILLKEGMSESSVSSICGLGLDEIQELLKTI